MLRRIGAVLAGLVVAWLGVFSSEAIVHKLYPPPPGTNMNDFNQVKQFVATLPIAALVTVLAGWLIGTLAGTFVSARLGRSAVPGYVTGGILLAAGVANAIIIPQPVWFSAVSFVIYIGATMAGSRMGRPAVRSAA
jgi:hypothetical protein